MPTSIPNFNFLARLVSEIWGGSKLKKVGAPDFRRRPLVYKFLYGALIHVNAYKCAKFQVPSAINYADMEGGPKIKSGGSDFPRRPLADNFFYTGR